MKKSILILAFGASLLGALPAQAAEPSLHQVYETANAGRLDEAQRMMQGVLEAHPQSGKAHYVEAELLARQGQYGAARQELEKAEQLSPGLPFASAQSVSDLRRSVQHSTASSTSSRALEAPAAAPALSPNASFSLPGMLAIGLFLLGFIYLASQWMSKRQAAGLASANGAALEPNTWGQHSNADAYRAGNAYAANPATYPPANAPGYASYPGNPAYPPAAGPMGNTGSGMGSRILGGLATGAAIGAGVAAGESLVHHWLDGSRDGSTNALNGSDHLTGSHGLQGFEGLDPFPAERTGGFSENDFGVSDSGGWDDSATDSSDWN